MNIKNTVIGLALVIALGLGVVNWYKPIVVKQTIQQPVGSLASPEISSDYVSFNGIRYDYRKMNFALATTTPCAMQSPAATSTLLYTSAIVTTATGTATTWTAAKSATPTATTTVINSFSLGSGLQGTMTTGAASTTLDGPNIFSPNNYVVWGVAGLGVTPTTNTVQGTCQAVFVEAL